MKEMQIEVLNEECYNEKIIKKETGIEANESKHYNGYI